MDRLTRDLGHVTLDVAIGDDFAGLGEAAQGQRAVLWTDPRVAQHWVGPVVEALNGWEVAVEVLDIDETRKNLDLWRDCVERMLALGVDRKTVVFALGGGVIGDVVGFAAATTLRGLPLVQLPTSLLAMVDSSVGGKTGVNTDRGKNLVGAFYQPGLVWAALQTLETLPQAEWRSGLGEVVKTALIRDEGFFEALEADATALRDRDRDATREAVLRCVSIKADVVQADERESGVRAILNAGHTVGHALETALGHGVLRHGEAVALGLLAECRWSVKNGLCTDVDLPDRLARLFERLGLPTRAPDVAPAALLGAMKVDKKAAGNTLWVPVPVRVGEVTLVSVPFERLGELISELR